MLVYADGTDFVLVLIISLSLVGLCICHVFLIFIVVVRKCTWIESVWIVVRHIRMRRHLVERSAVISTNTLRLQLVESSIRGIILSSRCHLRVLLAVDAIMMHPGKSRHSRNTVYCWHAWTTHRIHWT